MSQRGVQMPERRVGPRISVSTRRTIHINCLALTRHARATAYHSVVHQPVERLIAQWIQWKYPQLAFQRVSLHDDDRDPGVRHGLTIMQRRVNLDIDCGVPGKGYDLRFKKECESMKMDMLVFGRILQLKN